LKLAGTWGDSVPHVHLAGNALGQRLLREHLASIYFIYNATCIGRAVFVVVLGIFMHLQAPHPLVWPFVALHLVLCIGLYLVPRWNPSVPVSESGLWARRISVIVVLLGFADALAPWLFVQAGNLPVTCVLMVVMMGNCARAIQSLRPVKAALIGYTLPMMGGLITALAAQGDRVHMFLAVFAAIYLLMMLRVGVQEHKHLVESLILRFENESLAQRLGEQIAATERASAEKSRFLAAASHDLRQPLHAIALFSAALENALRDRPEGRNAERLTRTVRALGTSLDSMLDISRLDARMVTPELQAVQLDALFLSLNHMFSAQAEQKELQLRIRASGLWVRSDPQLLYRMLGNLIDNALKYSTRGGVAVVARARGDSVWIEIHDTGIGIAPQQMAHIFEEFYQAHNPGRDRARGLGIGLSIVQRLSRLLDHPVEVRSRPGCGSRFRLVLPAERVPALPVVWNDLLDEHNAVAPPGLQGRALLIDDEAAIREAMEALLRSWSVDVRAVASEAEAVDALVQARREAKPYTWLICDYRLSENDSGLDLGLRLRQRFAADIALLLVTGETAPERLQRVRESDVPVLFKPVDASALRQAMVRLAPSQPPQPSQP
jgi:signal transduction histidine kinase/ActR/RegA family two-component response regulator